LTFSVEFPLLEPEVLLYPQLVLPHRTQFDTPIVLVVEKTLCVIRSKEKEKFYENYCLVTFDELKFPPLLAGYLLFFFFPIEIH
jgi:hypothetical protein